MSIENILELGCYVTAVVFVTNITECSRQTNIREVKTLLYQRQKMTDVKKKKQIKRASARSFKVYCSLFFFFLAALAMASGRSGPVLGVAQPGHVHQTTAVPWDLRRHDHGRFQDVLSVLSRFHLLHALLHLWILHLAATAGETLVVSWKLFHVDQSI
jgi:hypothetical protein